MVETAKYTITGLVDFSDEQGNIRGQFPVGSVQELPVAVGNKAVEDGQAELFVETEGDSEQTVAGEDSPADAPADEVVADEPVGEKAEDDESKEDEVE